MFMFHTEHESWCLKHVLIKLYIMFLLCSTSSQSQCSIEDVDQSQVEPVKSWPSLCSCVFVIFRNTIISCIDTRYCRNKLIRGQSVLFITKPSSCLILRCFYTSDWTEDWVPISVCVVVVEVGDKNPAKYPGYT